MHLPKVIAHRGASQIAPENTLIAFELAAQLGASMVEFDVMLTQDNVPIVHHDDSFARILNLALDVHDTPYALIQNKDAGSWFNSQFSSARIPTLAQTLTCCAKNHLVVNIELKTTDHFAKETALQTIKILKTFDFFTAEHVLFSSQSRIALEIIRANLPGYKLGLVADNWKDVNAALTMAQLYAFSLHYSMLNLEKVHELKKKNYQVLAFTVNDPILAESLFTMGVTGIFSDYPQLY